MVFIRGKRVDARSHCLQSEEKLKNMKTVKEMEVHFKLEREIGHPNCLKPTQRKCDVTGSDLVKDVYDAIPCMFSHSTPYIFTIQGSIMKITVAFKWGHVKCIFSPYKWPSVLVFMTKWKCSKNPSSWMETCTFFLRSITIVVHRFLTHQLCVEMQKPHNHSPFLKWEAILYLFLWFSKEPGCSHEFRHTTLGEQISSTSYSGKTNSHKFSSVKFKDSIRNKEQRRKRETEPKTVVFNIK